MSLFRSAQQDLTLSLADNLVRPELVGQLTSFLEKITAKPMIRRLDFPTMQGMCTSDVLPALLIPSRSSCL
jgi:hypothetical protein